MSSNQQSGNSPVSFNQQRILSLESRMAEPMRRLIEKYGGIAQVAPSVKEVALQDNLQAFSFFKAMEVGEYDLLILMTGVGLKTLLKILETKFDKKRIIEGFKKTKVVVRGPKPTRVCKIEGIGIAVTIPPPNTWQEILQILSEENLLSGKKVALLEYGRPDENFYEQLTSRGAELSTVQVYKWDLPEDTQPLRQALQDIISGKIDLLLQTSAIQIDHLLSMCADKWEELKLRRALARVAIISIGPTTSAHLRDRQLFPDLEVFPNKMEQLVEQAAIHGAAILAIKRKRATESWVRVSQLTSGSSELIETRDSNFLKISLGRLLLCV